MNLKPGIRNFVHHKFSLLTNFSLSDYAAYLEALKQNGVTEIEHAGKSLTFPVQEARLRKSVDLIHRLDMKAILYTGVFGTENLSTNPHLEKYAQRDQEGNVLSYAGKSSAMMCPASKYVDEVTIPRLLNVLAIADLDGVFVDIPWIMRGGCFCPNCHDLREDGADNPAIVRHGLEKIVTLCKKQKPSLQISVNASAPTIHNNRSSGAYVDNLNGIFDEFVTEWNPFRWNQDPYIVTRCIEYTRDLVNARVLHATTATDKNGRMYSVDQYERLFRAILKGGATPRLGISFNGRQLQVIGDAWNRALEKSA